MPWNIDGTFTRKTNNTTEVQGDKLWQQDLTASIKIIASRHDVHDRDLATGITRCLNLDGYNAMAADLKMGGNKVTNTVPGTVSSDLATYGQIAGDLLFDNGLRVLTLNDRDGSPIDTVTIPSGTGGGGEGTVTAISGDGTLQLTPATITTSGSVGLKSITTGQNYTGGISSIQVDNYGRVTQVVPGAFANTNLGNVPASTSVQVTSSTGSNTTIPAAVPDGSAGVMTGLMAKQLADLVAAGVGGGMIPAIKLRGVPDGIQQVNLQDAVTGWTEEFYVNNVDNVYTDIINITGSGVVNYLGIAVAAWLSASLVNAELLIDGVKVWNKDSVMTDPTFAVGDGVSLIGEVDAGSPPDLKSFQQVYFSQSLVLRMQVNTSSSTAFRAFIRWVQFT